MLASIALLTALSVHTAPPAAAASGTALPLPDAAPRMRSVPAFVTGLVLDVTGMAAVFTGVAFLAQQEDCDPDDGLGALGCSFGNGLAGTFGAVTAASGGLLLAIGLSLTIYGGLEPEPSVVPTVSVGPGNVGLSWRL